jgi:hypothetical protein
MIQVVKKNIVQQNKAERHTFAFQNFPLGLNSSVPSSMLNPEELGDCIDYRLGSKGELIDREAVIKYSSVATSGDPISMAHAILSGTAYDIIAATDYKIYYMNALVPTLIGTAESTPYLIPFNDACLICDGSYLKYIDGISGIKMAYDAGSGGTQFDNLAGEDDSGLAVGNGTNTRVAVKFTSDSWTSGYTIPLTQIECFLKGVGSPTGTITAKLRLVSDDSVLATKDLDQDAADISTSGEFVSFVFASGDITTEMSPSIDYYATVEYSGGDASNYIELRCTTETGTAYYYTGSWVSDSTKNPIMKVYPGTAPKCGFGVVSNRRPFLAGDPDNKGYVWYGNLGFLDFSTTNGGGYIGVIDENNNSFEVGALQDLYGDLFVYGTEDEPYISKLIKGDQPSDYELPLTFQKSWATQKTLINTKNDLWNGTSDGIDSLTGVQEQGDFRSGSISESVDNKIADYWSSSTAFAGYYPKHGHFLLFMPLLGKVLVGHTRNKLTSEDGRTKYPWTEFDLPVTPTSFCQLSSGFMIGADDGFLYTFDPDESKDLTTTQISPIFETAYVEFPFDKVTVEQLQFIAGSFAGASFKIDIYINGNDSNYILQLSANMSMSDSLLVSEATGLVSEATGLVSGETKPPRVDLNFNCDSIKFKVHTITKISSDHVFFNGIFFKYYQIGV